MTGTKCQTITDKVFGLMQQDNGSAELTYLQIYTLQK